MAQLPPVHRGIPNEKLKGGVFALEALNSLATTYFFYDVYFYTQAKFGFDSLRNLLLAALLGVVYMVAAFFAGRFAQRFGYFTSVKCGACLMALAFLAGSQVEGMWPLIGLIIVGNIGQCFTWPALEALMSEGEPPARLQSLVGIYNVTWAAAQALAYFSGGAMLQRWGWRSLFFVPAGLLALELALAFWLERRARSAPSHVSESDLPLLRPVAESYSAGVSPKSMLSMALLSNPLAYLAINTIISTVPSLAKHLRLSPMLASFVCSTWLFTRAISFVLLRLWPRWHYRFGYLAWAYVSMVISFGAILLLQNIWVLLFAQLIFGLAVGLIYYSSLFYSMDIGENKGEHGGIHEAAIGAGSAAGPAIAAMAMAFFPAIPGSGAAAVCVLLLGGFGGLFWMRFRRVS